jgi:DNA ligase 1
MKAFANLLERLVYTRARNDKLRLIADYLRETPDPDRGWALAALTDATDFPAVKAGTVRDAAATRVDPVLLKLSRDYVGDTAETVSLIWPVREGLADGDLSLGEVVSILQSITRRDVKDTLADLLDRLDVSERFALLKLAMGGLRIGISARLAKTAFAQAFGLDVSDVEEVWHALQPPYAPLFAWAEGQTERPSLEDAAYFRPFMLAHPLEGELPSLDGWLAEWKWDGIRIQIAGTGLETRLFSRGGDEISGAFPEIVEAFSTNAVVDGELLVRGAAQGGEAGSFNALQQRLGRKVVSVKMLAEAPAFVRLYDVLFDEGRDVRALPLAERRPVLEAVTGRLPSSHFDLSQPLDVESFASLGALRDSARDANIEGVMLKRLDSPYVAGRVTGLWYKWKRDPLTADCVMMYAQRGNGRRASFYSDYTFGCWTEGGELLPVGKAYSGFTDEELVWLDKFVRANTLNRFGPVREVEKTLVLEVKFDSIHASKRHKSGLAMRFPRISRIRKDKPASEADRVEMLLAMAT